jgi:hypothetical protein
MSKEYRLTTFDNPFDPFEQFDSWLLFDNEKGYNSCGKLMRIALISDDMSQAEIDDEIERAIDVIIANDFTNTFKKVERETA